LEANVANNNQDTPQINTTQVSTNNLIDSLIIGDFFKKNTYKSFSSSLHYKWEVDTLGRKFELVGELFKVKNHDKDNYDSNYFNPSMTLIRNETFRSNVPIEVNIYTLKADYEHPFKKKNIFALGTKYSKITTFNDNVFEIFEDPIFVNDPNRTNNFKYDEHILAGYIDYTTSIGKYDIELGLRTEYSKTNGVSETTNQNFTNEYIDWFPSFHMSSPLGKKSNHSLSFSYTRKIDRPNYSDLNPFQYFIDPFTSINR